MPGEGRPGRGQLFEKLSLRILDGDAIGAEPCEPIVGSERLMGRPFFAKPDCHIGPFKFPGLSFQAPEHSADDQIGTERLVLVPILEAAMGINHITKGVEHR